MFGYYGFFNNKYRSGCEVDLIEGTNVYVFDTKSATFVDDALGHIFSQHNLIDDEYRDLIENCVRSIAVLAEFQKMVRLASSYSVNKTGAAVLSGYVIHFITELISARGYIQEIERKIAQDVPGFPLDDFLITQFDRLYPDLQGIRNTLEHNAERRRRIKAGRVPIPTISPLLKQDGTYAKCGELVIFPPSIVKCHLSSGEVGEVDLELTLKYACKLVTETVKRFPMKNSAR